MGQRPDFCARAGRRAQKKAAGRKGGRATARESQRGGAPVATGAPLSQPYLLAPTAVVTPEARDIRG